MRAWEVHSVAGLGVGMDSTHGDLTALSAIETLYNLMCTLRRGLFYLSRSFGKSLLLFDTVGFLNRWCKCMYC